jgi:hypothetical protein
MVIVETRAPDEDSVGAESESEHSSHRVVGGTDLDGDQSPQRRGATDDGAPPAWPDLFGEELSACNFSLGGSSSGDAERLLSSIALARMQLSRDQFSSPAAAAATARAGQSRTGSPRHHKRPRGRSLAKNDAVDSPASAPALAAIATVPPSPLTAIPTTAPAAVAPRGGRRPRAAATAPLPATCATVEAAKPASIPSAQDPHLRDTGGLSDSQPARKRKAQKPHLRAFGGLAHPQPARKRARTGTAQASAGVTPKLPATENQRQTRADAAVGDTSSGGAKCKQLATSAGAPAGPSEASSQLNGVEGVVSSGMPASEDLVNVLTTVDAESMYDWKQRLMVGQTGTVHLICDNASGSLARRKTFLAHISEGHRRCEVDMAKLFVKCPHPNVAKLIAVIVDVGGINGAISDYADETLEEMCLLCHYQRLRHNCYLLVACGPGGG